MASRSRSLIHGSRPGLPRRHKPILEQVERRSLLATFFVTHTGDSGANSLRWAIEQANARPGFDNIIFGIPASTAPNLDVPVPGFDPITQTWRIRPQTPLPALTDPVSIDGYTQAHSPVLYRYPEQVTNTVQRLTANDALSGSFFLTTVAPLLVGTVGRDDILTNTTVAFDYDISQGISNGDLLDSVEIAFELGKLVGAGNVLVTGGPLPTQPIQVEFIGDYEGLAIPNLRITDINGNTLADPTVTVTQTTGGGTATGDPVEILSQSNTLPALDGNDAKVRVIIDGTQIDRGLFPDPRGFVFNTSHSLIRGLSIDGFGVGVEVPSPDREGNLIQGNFIGRYAVYPVDPETGEPSEEITALVLGVGNDRGVVLASTNATVGGVDPQASNVISGNRFEGVWIRPGGVGNQVLNNQIGVVGPVPGGRYFQIGNGAEGVKIESSSTLAASSNAIGGAVDGSGNVISANGGHGVWIVGAGATRNRLEGNYIGAAPGGGFKFGAGDPGNQGDGVRIENAPDNRVGGPTDLHRNIVSANQGAGVRIMGGGAVGNVLRGNYIGLTAAGDAVLGNALEGVVLEQGARNAVVGPGNVISANLRGVLVGPGTSGHTIQDNFIGTDSKGVADLGNAHEGIRIDNAPGLLVRGDGKGSQVISGNNIGVAILGPAATGTRIEGNFIGTDVEGLSALGNSEQGVLIENAPGNQVGGLTEATRNVISTNHWGIEIRGAQATGNAIQGNAIGTDLEGVESLGNEVHGVWIRAGASTNRVGGFAAGAGNTIAFNEAIGILIEGAGSIRNSILTNAIYSNVGLGIDLVGGANGEPPLPVLSRTEVQGTTLLIEGSLVGLPNTTSTVQLFTNAECDPSGFGEGQKFLGSALVTFNAAGLATFALSISTVDVAGPYITATATDAAGNSSEFSACSLSALPGPVSVQFASARYSFSESSGAAEITLTRTGGNLSETVSVTYATGTGTAIPGVNYVPVLAEITFAPGQRQAIFTVPLLFDTAGTGTLFVSLLLSDPTGGAILGTPATATLEITEVVPPRVTGLAAVPGVWGTSQLIVQFDQAMNEGRAEDLANYGYSVRTPGRDRRIGTRDDLLIGLTGAIYDAASRTVTLRMASPIHAGATILLQINAVTGSPSSTTGVASAQGVLLDGNGDGRPGGTFTGTVTSQKGTTANRFQRPPAWTTRLKPRRLPRVQTIGRRVRPQGD